MNERIRELEKQATDIVKCGLNGTATAESFNRKKFAQLIVRECAGIYDKIDNGNLHMGTDDYLEALDKTFFGVEL